MADSRRTRKRKFHAARRQTRRSVIQRGGAAWPNDIPDDFISALPEEFAIFKKVRGPTPDVTSMAGDLVKAYISCIERQDELFETVVKLIRTKVSSEITGTDLTVPRNIVINAAAIDLRKGEALPYIDAAEKLINFKVDDIVSETLGETKLQEIRKNPLITLSHLLLFPKKLNNLLVEALANIFIALRGNEESLLINDAALPILASQYEGYAQSLAYTLTAKPLRDGFFLNQSILDFKNDVDSDYLLPEDHPGIESGEIDKINEGDKFWISFVKALFINRNITALDALFKHDSRREAGCKRRMREGTSTWGKIAADVFKFHTLQPNGDILSLFTEECSIDPKGTATDEDFFEFIPNKEFLDIGVRGTTLKKLMSNMSDTTLQFILQLSYSIKKAIKADAEEKAAAAATVSTT